MNILAFSDLHRNRSVAEQIAAEAPKADLVVGAGDFATLGQGLADTVTALSIIDVPMVIVAGNHDHLDQLSHAFRDRANVRLLHGTSIIVGRLKIGGLGFEIGTTPGALPESILSEPDAGKLLDQVKGADVLVTHAPPFGVADIQRDNSHQGSRSVRAWIERAQPGLCLCGHIHNAWGTTGSIGWTRVHNLGPTLNWFRL